LLVARSSSGMSYLEIANNVIKALDSIDNNPKKNITLPNAIEYLKTRIEKDFPSFNIAFEKRKASPSQIVVSGSKIIFRDSPTTIFSQIEVDALYHHEIETHILTFENGLKQDNLTFLSKASPRTNRTQEGLAIVSECLNGCAEPNRMRKVATRVIAIADALNGAHFEDLYQLFQNNGQNEQEAYYSAQRILRGGQPHYDGAVFTKDLSYLAGMVDLYNKVRLKDFNHEDFKLLFAGKTYHKNLDIYTMLRDKDIMQKANLLPTWFKEEKYNDFQQKHFDGKDLSIFISEKGNSSTIIRT